MQKKWNKKRGGDLKKGGVIETAYMTKMGPTSQGGEVNFLFPRQQELHVNVMLPNLTN